MDGMAAQTGHAVQGVRGSPDICATQGVVVARKAIIDGLFRRQLGKRDDTYLARRFYVLASWPMAAFAPGFLRCLRTLSNTLEVRIFIECRPNVLMTPLAYCTSDETGDWCCNRANGGDAQPGN